MLKADARRQQAARSERPARTSLGESARRKRACCRFARIPRLHGEGLPTVCARLVRSRSARRILGLARRQPDASSASASRRCTFPAGMTCFLRGSIDGFLALDQMRGERICARASIPDRRTLGAHSVGRPRRRGGLRRRSAARHGCNPAALVRSLAERFGRVCRRAAHPSFRAGRKSLARSRSVSRARRATRSILHSAGRANSRKGDGTLSVASPRVTNRATFLSTILKFRCSRREGQPRQAGNSIRPLWSWEIIFWCIRRKPLDQPVAIFGTPRVSLYCFHFLALIRISPRSLCACGRTARRNLFASALRDPVGFLRRPATRRTKFISGNSILNRLPAALRRAIAFAWKLPAARFRFTTAIPGTAVPSCRATFVGLAAVDADRPPQRRSPLGSLPARA